MKAVYIFIALIFAGVLPAAGAGINVTPYHITLADGEVTSVEVKWTVTEGQIVQVYKSVNNGTEQLVAETSASGSISVGGISCPNYYAFKLYQGTSRANLIAWTSVTTQPYPATSFGINTVPTHLGYFTDENYSSKYNTLLKEQVHLASMGGGYYRFNIWNTGVRLDYTNHTLVFESDFYEITRNLVDWLKRTCHPNKFRVMIAFHNDYMVHRPDNENPNYWWQEAGLDWNHFLQRSADWQTWIVNAIESDEIARQVVFAYDYQNEVYQDNPYQYPYVNFMYDNVPVPMGKRLISFSFKTTISDYHTRARNGRRFDYVSLHFYPDAQANWDDEPAVKVPYWVNQTKSLYPGATLLMGESGYKGGATFPNDEGTSPCSEDNQAVKMTEMAQAAIDCGLITSMPWEFCSFSQGIQPNYALGYDIHKPKDALTALTEIYTTQYNPGAETVVNGVPDGWQGSGTKAVTFASVGPDSASAATGDYRAGVTMSTGTSSDYMYIDSPAISDDNIGGKIAYVNAFVKSGNSCTLGIREYDANWNVIRNQYCTASITPSVWTNMQHAVGPWTPTLHANTKHFKVRVRGRGMGAMDVDNVSAYVRGLARLETASRMVEFSGGSWAVASSIARVSPGPCRYSDSADNVWVDENGKLHLKITYDSISGQWKCAMLTLNRGMGYGFYRIYLDSRVDDLDPNMVCGLYTSNGLDCLFSRFGNPISTSNARYVVEPSVNYDFVLPVNRSISTHQFLWRPDKVSFKSGDGFWGAFSNPAWLYRYWNYTNAFSIPAADNRYVKLGLWLYNGYSPLYGQEREVVVKKFEYVPVMCAINNRAVLDAVMSSATGVWLYRACGSVRVADSDAFDLDDGSGVTLRVECSGHNLLDNQFVSVLGALEIVSTSRTLRAVPGGVCVVR